MSQAVHHHYLTEHPFNTTADVFADSARGPFQTKSQVIHKPLREKISHRSKRAVLQIPHNDMIHNFDFEYLLRSNQITSHLYIRLRKCCLPTRMVALCAHGTYVPECRI
jgi:hypothetical protein